MAEQYPSHYRELVDDVVTKEKAHAHGIAITVIPSLMERTDGLGVFEEGAIFSGSEARGPIEACITSVASPYVPPRIPREVFLNASETILGSRPLLPEGMADLPELPAHLIVWWGNKDWDDDGQAGILRLAEESSQAERDDFREVIEEQVTRAVSIVQQVSGRKPLIQSSWGHATPEERSDEGKSRGGPSNKHGHLHILDLNPAEQSIEVQDDLLAREKLNHFGPWNALTHQTLSGPTTRILGNIAHDTLPNNNVTSEAFTDFHFGANGTSAYCDGYRLLFDQPIGFGEAFDCLATIANSFEGFYQDIATLHSDFYKHPADPDVRSITRDSLARRATEFGFTDLEAEKLVSFVLSIRPTYSQVRNWHHELLASDEDPDSLDIMDKLIGRYERVAHVLGSLTGNYPAYLNLIRDTVSPPEQFREIQSVWPVHLGASFVIDNYTIKDGELVVYSMSLTPNIDTIKGVEYIAGALLKRAKGSNT